MSVSVYLDLCVHDICSDVFTKIKIPTYECVFCKSNQYDNTSAVFKYIFCQAKTFIAMTVKYKEVMKSTQTWTKKTKLLRKKF